MKGPSIAVMLGGAKHDDAEDSDSGELSLSEAKSSAEDAATAFADAVESKDAKRIVKSFGALAELCAHVSELKDSGEKDEDEDTDEADESAED